MPTDSNWNQIFTNEIHFQEEATPEVKVWAILNDILLQLWLSEEQNWDCKKFSRS